MNALERSIVDYVDQNTGRLVELVRDLVRIPSENTPPVGQERACQDYIVDTLRSANCEVDLYELRDVAGLDRHPLYWPGRDYENRPNVGARKMGSGGGRSLLLSGHIDTVPQGTLPWTRDPFGGEVVDGRLYGRGANDMKGGVASNLFALEALDRLGIRLDGDLLFESVVDEEFGGGNGTLAGRLRGWNADAAVISEPSFLRVCPAQRGGRTAHITFSAPGGVLTDGRYPGGVVDQLRCFLSAVPEFAAARKANAQPHEAYLGSVDPVPVSITKILTGPWGNREPIGTPESCRVEFYWQLMPGETQTAVECEFYAWLDTLCVRWPEFFSARPEVELPIRWMPGSAIPVSHDLVTELVSAGAAVLGSAPPVAGIEGPCDMYIFHEHFRIPAVLWGVRGGNTHGSDEYVEIQSLTEATKVLLTFISRWCGVSR